MHRHKHNTPIQYARRSWVLGGHDQSTCRLRPRADGPASMRPLPAAEASAAAQRRPAKWPSTACRNKQLPRWRGQRRAGPGCCAMGANGAASAAAPATGPASTGPRPPTPARDSAMHGAALARVLDMNAVRFMELVRREPLLFAFEPDTLEATLEGLSALTGLQVDCQSHHAGSDYSSGRTAGFALRTACSPASGQQLILFAGLSNADARLSRPSPSPPAGPAQVKHGWHSGGASRRVAQAPCSAKDTTAHVHASFVERTTCTAFFSKPHHRLAFPTPTGPYQVMGLTPAELVALARREPALLALDGPKTAQRLQRLAHILLPDSSGADPHQVD
jgi:hypothetical protein